MDSDYLITASLTSGIVSIIYAVYKICKHVACKSDCCGKKSTMTLDLTPPRDFYSAQH